MSSSADQIYRQPINNISDFVFDSKVADVFADMVVRSVPAYDSIITMTGAWAKQYVSPNSYCYDLGCSLGASTFAMIHQIPHQNYQLFAIDLSPAMLQRLQQQLKSKQTTAPVNLICADIEAINISNASMVVLNFTLQFIAPQQRSDLLNKIYQGLLPNGILILSEKIAFNNVAEQQCYQTWHEAFKQAHGYTKLEISQKRQALEQVLIPETIEQHKKRFLNTGFKYYTHWLQCLNFASWILYKQRP